MSTSRCVRVTHAKLDLFSVAETSTAFLAGGLDHFQPAALLPVEAAVLVVHKVA